MADVDLQALLDPSGNGTGVMIIRRNDSGLKANYYCVPVVTLAGHARWVETTAADSDADKATAILAGLA